MESIDSTLQCRAKNEDAAVFTQDVVNVVNGIRSCGDCACGNSGYGDFRIRIRAGRQFAEDCRHPLSPLRHLHSSHRPKLLYLHPAHSLRAARGAGAGFQNLRRFRALRTALYKARWQRYCKLLVWRRGFERMDAPARMGRCVARRAFRIHRDGKNRPCKGDRHLGNTDRCYSS